MFEMLKVMVKQRNRIHICAASIEK